jgi:hypothetical protein
MSGWPLPSFSAGRNVTPGNGPFNDNPNAYRVWSWRQHKEHSKKLIYWRVPRTDNFSVPDGDLTILPSRNNLTGTPFSTTTPKLSGQQGLAVICRRQTHTLFTFSIYLSLRPQTVGQEAGVTIFLTQVNHIDLGIVC